MKRLIFFIALFALGLNATQANAQSRQIRGVVRDDKGTLPGVTVQEKGLLTNGVATNVNGEYKLTLRGNQNVVIVKAIGYITKEVDVSDKTVIDVLIQQSSQDLSEVVVVGYGIQKKLTFTGSQSAVSGAQIRENPSASLQNTLAGRVTGFISQQRSGQPGSDGAAFLVRGQGSLNGNDNPLIIVDDIEYTYEQFARLDPNEVESVTVLKDASQTAVYGIKGGNGVVVVTTRRGKTGKPRISFRTDYGLSDFTILPTYLDSYNTALLRNLADVNDNKYSASPNPNFKPTWTDQDLALFQNGQDPYGHPNVDWKKELFKNNAAQYKATFDVSGGTDKLKYFISLSYLNQGGNTRDYSQGQGYDGNFYNRRYNYRSNLDINVNSNLSLSIDAYGNIGEINTPSVAYNSTNGNKNDVFSEFGSYLALAPYAYPIKNPNGSFGYSNYQKTLTGYVTPNIIQRLSLDGYNRNYENNMVLTTSVNEKLGFITEGLSAKGTVSYTSNYTGSKGLTRTNLPSYIYTPANGTTPESYAPAFTDVYRLERLGTNYNPNGPNFGTQRRITAQAFLNYDRTFHDHHVSGLALYSLTSFNRGLATTNINYGNYNFIPNNTIGTTGRLGYDYKSKYIVQFSGAYNGSSRFTGDKRFGLFPAASVAYNVAEEPFFKNNIKFINQFKLRGSYGLVGSDQINNNTQSYTYLQSYISTNGNVSGQPGQGVGASFGETNGALPVNTGIQEGTLPNIAVTWDKEKQLDIGVDFTLFNSKLSGSVDYFKYNRYDQLISRGTVSAIFGQTLPPVNLGRTSRNGLEFELNFHDVIGKNFNYNFRATYSKVRSKVVFFDEASVQYPWQAYTGHSLNTEARYQFIGFYKDAADVAASPKPTVLTRPGDLKYADLNNDNIIDQRDQAVSDVNNVPVNNYGFQVGFGYKSFSISALFQGATDFNIRGYEESIRAFSSNLTAVHQQSWTPELGDNAKYPLLSSLRSISDPTFASTFWSISGNYLRLRTAEVSYTLPGRFLKKIGLQGARVYLSGNNLVTWSNAFKLYALDPEATNNTDRQTYPPQRIYNIGLSVSFN
ncbi:SusC/RagA family TonB-linked outer membrane protein [Mucilaginibacter glaciei]|uniref:TonB-dependent receptor n=1 Tax=Mucilaginibacter glaciei TaxID=2772109 RepID=A0A926NUR1_9SPHI|nr:TonB-dependent receptor [Mucilaginibacter glaciei]MBD1395357.1 TonB-dependent receptor [Mucilaginibacter glaciei]